MEDRVQKEMRKKEGKNDKRKYRRRETVKDDFKDRLLTRIGKRESKIMKGIRYEGHQ